MSQPLLGYFFSPSGLNNQKLALLGLVLTAWHTGPRRIALPALCNYDLHDDSRTPMPFGHSYDAQPFGAFAARHGIDIAWADAVDGLGNDYFAAVPALIGADVTEGRFGPAHMVCDFYRGLVPHLRHSALLRRLAETVFRARGIRIVAQLRIEQDWVVYAADTLQNLIGPSEDHAPGFQQIIAKIRNTLPDWEAGIYVVCDEAALPLPKEEIRAVVRAEQGVDLVWKSDFLPPDDWREMLAIHRSILDFEMASLAPTFVGLTRSTFSNLVTLELFARTRRQVTNHYIYNLPGPKLARRLDNGTHATAALATSACVFADLE